MVYRAGPQVHESHDLYSVPTAGGVVLKINGPLVPGGTVLYSFQIGPDNDHVVYMADQITLQQNELFVTYGDNLLAQLPTPPGPTPVPSETPAPVPTATATPQAPSPEELTDWIFAPVVIQPEP